MRIFLPLALFAAMALTFTAAVEDPQQDTSAAPAAPATSDTPVDPAAVPEVPATPAATTSTASEARPHKSDDPKLRGTEPEDALPAPAPVEKDIGPDGTKLKMLINCFAWYLPDAAYRGDNSKVHGCDESTIQFCKTDSGNNDHMCKFDGSNHLRDAWGENPACYFNCQMETCDSWGSPSTDATRACVAALGH